MSEKKNIDRLFQEKLKDLEVQPDASVWNDIASRLQHKKKRRVIPIWLRLSGVAAGLLLFLLLGNKLLFNPSTEIHTNTPTPEIVDTEKSNTGEPASTDQPQEESISNSQKVATTSDNKENTTKRENIQSDKVQNKKLIKQNAETSVASANNKILKEEDVVRGSQTVVTTNNNDTSKNTTTSSSSVAKNVVNSEVESSGVAVAQTIQKEALEDSLEKENSKEDTTIEEAIAINDALKEEPKDDPEANKRWSVAPNVAPVYFNTLGEGSSIHSDFSQNAKSGDVNMSYGITATYAVNDKLSVRTGVNKVQLGYTTNDVFAYNGFQANFVNTTLKNISLNNPVSNMALVSANSFNDTSTELLRGNSAAIDQQFGFIEVPLELQYSLLNKKFGVNVIGGFSALFLDNNDVFSVYDGQKSLLGSATNINKTSYSANLGFGLHYKMSKTFNLNLEPMFKYQLNTFKNTSGDFKPYFIGFYTGFSFKF